MTAFDHAAGSGPIVMPDHLQARFAGSPGIVDVEGHPEAEPADLPALGGPRSMVDHALAYARHGWPVFPCDPRPGKGCKRPLVSGGFKAATCDEAQIRRWWAEHPGAMIGAPMGPATALAFDPDAPKKPGDLDGVANWNALAAEHGGIPPTRCHLTPGGGRHYLFAHPDGFKISTSEGLLAGMGINVRGGDKGYVILPPSRVSGGRAYRLADPEHEWILAPTPGWLLDRLTGSRKSAARAPETDPTRSNLGMAEGPDFAAKPETSGNVAIVWSMLAAVDADATYPTWRDLVWAVAELGWTCGRALAREWSTRGAKFDTGAFDVVWDSYRPKPGGVTFGTLVHHAIAAGYSGDLTGGPVIASSEAGGGGGQPGAAASPTSASATPAAHASGPLDLSGLGDLGADAPPSSAWPEPKPLPTGLLPVAPFDVGMVPAAIGPWVMDVAERMQCPPDFVAASIVVGLGAVLGRKVAIRPQRHTDWFEVANLWGCIVGRPGAMKSPAMAAALKPLDRLEAGARKENEEAQSSHAHDLAAYQIKKDAALKSAREAAKNGGDIGSLLTLEPPTAPKLKRYQCNDPTYEALGAVMADNPNGVLVFRDELVSLLKTLDREDNAAARGFYLQAWAGTSGYTFDRILRGVIHIDAVCLSVLGSTQPGKLASYVGRALSGGEGDDGMMQRFGLLVWPDDDAAWREVDRHPDSAAREAAGDAFLKLDALTPAGVEAEQGDHDALPFLRFDGGAAELFQAWRAELEGRLRGGGMHAALVSHMAKYRKLVPALALLNHLADGGKGPVVEAAMRRALSFTAYLETHARRAYGSGRQVEVGGAKAILNRVRRGDLASEFTVRDVVRHEWSNLSDPDQVKASLDMLDDHGWVRARRVDTGGRPKMVFTPHPTAIQRPPAAGG